MIFDMAWSRSSVGVRRGARRGSVLILVVAVLALLVLMGTAYLVSARTDRANATAMSNANNIDLARSAVMGQLVQGIGGALLDANGQVSGYTTRGTYGTKASRHFDYPETATLPTPPGQTPYNGNLPDEPWLAATLHNHLVSGPGAGADTYSQFYSQNAGVLSFDLYDPNSGLYDIVPPVPPSSASVPDVTAYYTNAVDEQTPGAADPYNAASNPDGISPDAFSGSTKEYYSDSIFHVLPFSDASGVRYRVAWRIIDTSRMANLNTGATDDTVAMSDATGTDIASLRLAPANSGPNPYTSSPTYFNVADTPANLQYLISSPFGRSGNPASTFNFGAWESLVLNIESPPIATYMLFDSSDELELRSYGEFGTSYIPRPASSSIWPRTLGKSSSISGAPARRNYTTNSFSRLLRAYSDPVAGTYTLTFATGAYADGSSFKAPTDFTKDFGVFTLPTTPTASNAPQIINPNTAAHVWPTSPWNTLTSTSYQTALPRIPVNPTLTADTSNSPVQSLQQPSQVNWQSMYHLAATATNLATAMERVSGFSHAEACAFAANYVTSMWSGIQPDPDVVIPNVPANSMYAYYWPSGPSFVDDSGVCVRAAINAGSISPATDASITQIAANFGGSSGTTDVSSGAAGDIYLGFDAQPFFSKIAAQSTSDGKGNGVASVTLNDFAIELFNPYSVALSMRGYHLVDSASSKDIDLTQDDSNQKLYVPPNGFLIITNGTGSPALAPTPTEPPGSAPTVVVAKYSPANLPVSLGAGSTLTLRRLFIDRSFTNKLATVDRAGYTGVDAPNTIFAPSATSGVASLYISRGDVSVATMGAPGPASTATPYTLGTGATSPAYPLYDRSAASQSSPTPIAGLIDFNHIMRIGNFIDSTGTPIAASPPTTANGLLTERMATLNTIAPDMAPNNPGEYLAEAKESIIHFDFWVDPALFANTTLYPTPTAPLATDPRCDTRAFVLLECLAPIDRYYATNTSGNPDVSKYRLPGQINVNTASGDVLRALPGIQLTSGLYGDTTYPDKLVANLLAYRDRAGAGTYTYNGQSNTLNFTGYPGKGFHTMSELLTACDALLEVTPGHTPTSFDQRDQVWSSMFNLCTVRSDTFAVYGYLEAIKKNPAATSHNNGTDWYGAVSDDPHAASGIPNIRVARRRWIAIVDRSYCNYARSEPAFIVPQVVAIKDLPQ